MRRLLAVLVVMTAGVAGAVGVAIGQGTGGTLGPKAVGTQTFEVRIQERNVALNCPAGQCR